MATLGGRALSGVLVASGNPTMVPQHFEASATMLLGTTYALHFYAVRLRCRGNFAEDYSVSSSGITGSVNEQFSYCDNGTSFPDVCIRKQSFSCIYIRVRANVQLTDR